METETNRARHTSAYNTYRKELYNPKAQKSEIIESVLEKIVAQCIVCGVIIFGLLVLNLVEVDTPELVQVKQQIKTYVKKDQGINIFSKTFVADAKKATQAVLEGKNPKIQASSEENLNSVPEKEDVRTILNENEFRIDEDILTKINERVDTYSAPEKSAEPEKKP